jgi:hypothetical protein
MHDRHRPRLCESCQAPIAREDDACWRCATPSADDGPRSTPSTTRPPHSARQHQSTVDAGIVGRRAHATAARRRPVAATTSEPDLSRTAPAAASVPRRPAPGLVREGSSEPTPLFTRHTRGTIEAERDRRRQRGARGTIEAERDRRRQRGAIVHRGTVRERAASPPHDRIAAAVATNARSVTEAHLDMERWIDEGGLVPFEAAAPLRATTSRR